MSNESHSQKSTPNKTIALYATIALLGGVVIGLLYSNNDHDGMMGMNHNNSSQSDMMDIQPTPNASEIAHRDSMFFESMIPHHQQAIDMSNLALKNSKNAELIALANNIITAQTKEIAQMKKWLTDAGIDADAETHMGHGMGGMMNDNEMAELEKATGTDFDKLWLTGMIKHHNGALRMVHMIENSPNTETKTFGDNVIKAQSAEITQMQAMLDKLN